MQLKEEFRTYEALRREHDSQIVQIAMEGGLRIAPDQWSSLLYGDQSHKSHMQSIIDKVCEKTARFSPLMYLYLFFMQIKFSADVHSFFFWFSSFPLPCSCRPLLLSLKVSRS